MNLFLMLYVSHFFLGHVAFSQNGSKALQYCKQYAESVYVKEESPVLSLDSHDNKVGECAIEAVPLIVGGTAAKENEFPHMALIGYLIPEHGSDVIWACGGSLISDLFVLTAAHCAKSRLYKLQFVQLGTILRKNEESVKRNIANIIVHESYKSPVKYNDIALVQMDEPVEFSPAIRPACLNTNEKIIYKQAIAIGFGNVQYHSSESERLMKVDLDVIPREQCDKYFEEEKMIMPEGIISKQICAGVLTGGKDSCKGDSGGPLQVALEDPYCMYNIIGVTSFGKYCGIENSPGIYTKVSAYVNWIENIVWP